MTDSKLCTLCSQARCLIASLLCLLPLLSSGPGRAEAGLDFGYHDHQALHTYLVNVTQTYPHITRLHSIGKSIRGRDLWVIVIGQSPRDPVILRPNVKYVGNMHGNEAVGRELLLHLVEHLVTGYGHDDNVTHLLDTATVHIMPTMNPDGFAVANTTDCYGVQGRHNADESDLNRNFPDFFQENLKVIQPETQAIMKWIRDTQFVLSANLHGGSVVASYPFDSYSGVNRGPLPSLSPDDDVFIHLAQSYAFAHGTMRNHPPCVKGDSIFPNGITNGAAWYFLKGGMQDYNYVRASCYEMTLELSCCKYPPVSTLPQFWEENRKALMAYLLQVHIGVKGLVVDENNKTVSQAVVMVEGREQVPFRTSQYGEYWKLLLPGTYRLVVTKTGHGSKTVPFAVEAGRVTRLDVVLSSSGDDSGKGSNLVAASVLWLLSLGFLSLRLSAQ